VNHQTMLDLSVGVGEVCTCDTELLQRSNASYGEVRRDRVSGFTTRHNEIWVLVPDLLKGSDYSGNMVERSNYNVFLEKFSSVDGVISLVGGYGTYAIALTLKALRSEEIQECLAALSDYPLMDDENHTEMEWGAYEKQWVEHGATDFRDELNKHLKLEDDHVDLWDELTDITDSDLKNFYISCRSGNEEFINEEGYNSVWIFTDKAAKGSSVDAIATFIQKLKEKQSGVSQLSLELT